MKNAIIPTSPYANITLEPLNSEIHSIHELGDVLVIRHQGFHAKVSLYGGHVLSFEQFLQDNPPHVPSKTPHPIFWLTDTLHCGTNEKGKETAIRGGVPICWPWFGPHPEDNSKSHGFARNMIWQLVQVDVYEDSVAVILELSGVDEHSLWPQAFKLNQTITFSVNETKAFEQTLTMFNQTDDSVYYTGALHNYFQVSSPDNVRVKTLENVKYYDQLLDENCEPAVLPNCKGPIDRIYHTSDVMLLEDSDWQRTLEITSTNCKQWVLWNPGKEKAEKMADIHIDGEQHFVCLESANTQWQTIAPQSSVSISQSISVR